MAAFTDADLQAAAETYRRNRFNVSASARSMGLERPAMQRRLREAVKRNILGDEEMNPPNTPRRDDLLAARERKLAAFQRKSSRGNWRKLIPVELPNRPFRLKVFGDPHLDDDGCDFALFERHWREMDAETGVYGVCIGDWFNNWLRALGHLWKDTTTPPSDAWLLFEGLMEERGEALLGACSGNHDDWTHGPIDPVEMLMRQNGVPYRKGAIRLELRFPEADPVTVALRHKWRGRSQYSHAHGMVRALTFNNWYDNILVGGHIHVDEGRTWTCPETGRHATVCQVSAFKAFDDFADVHGFSGAQISPVWDLVVDPSLPDTDPDKIKVFWDSERARAYLEAIR
jgi:hypothetical protein